MLRAVARRVRGWGRNLREVIIVGDESCALDAAVKLVQREGLGYRVIEILGTGSVSPDASDGDGAYLDGNARVSGNGHARPAARGYANGNGRNGNGRNGNGRNGKGNRHATTSAHASAHGRGPESVLHKLEELLAQQPIDEVFLAMPLDRTQPLLPLRPGQVERGTHDYKRHGTTSLFAALELKTSRVIGQLHRRHRSREFREFLDVIEAQVPAELEVHIIVDNYGTHKTAMIRKWFAKRPRFHVHFTPTYGSWINLVERWFAELTNKRIRRGAFRSVKELEAALREYIAVHNENPKPFAWTRTADQILASIARYAQRTVVAPSS